MVRRKFSPLFYALLAILLLVIMLVDSAYSVDTDSVKQRVGKNNYTHSYEYDYISPTNLEEFDSLQKERTRVRNAPYVLVTSYKFERIYDYGTYEQIDSLKCIRFAEMSEIAKKIDKEIKLWHYKNKLEEKKLEKLNEPCK